MVHFIKYRIELQIGKLNCTFSLPQVVKSATDHRIFSKGQFISISTFSLDTKSIEYGLLVPKKVEVFSTFLLESATILAVTSV